MFIWNFCFIFVITKEKDMYKYNLSTPETYRYKDIENNINYIIKQIELGMPSCIEGEWNSPVYPYYTEDSVNVSISGVLKDFNEKVLDGVKTAYKKVGWKDVIFEDCTYTRGDVSKNTFNVHLIL